MDKTFRKDSAFGTFFLSKKTLDKWNKMCIIVYNYTRVQKRRQYRMLELSSKTNLLEENDYN